jgi:hypothetical protein
MNNSDHNSRRKITLDELMRLKRSERPDPSFWVDFDQSLKLRLEAVDTQNQTREVAFWRSIPVGKTLVASVPIAAAVMVGWVVWQSQSANAPVTLANVQSTANATHSNRATVVRLASAEARPDIDKLATVVPDDALQTIPDPELRYHPSRYFVDDGNNAVKVSYLGVSERDEGNGAVMRYHSGYKPQFVSY